LCHFDAEIGSIPIAASNSSADYADYTDFKKAFGQMKKWLSDFAITLRLCAFA